MSTFQLFVGIDIACETAQVEWRQVTSGRSQQQSIGQSQQEYERLEQQLRALNRPEETLVVMEATGNYWMALALFLHQHDFVVSVINPSQARAFAQARLQRTKTDAVDAHLLAEFARLLTPAAWTPPPAICDQLQQLLARRQDLILMSNQERNRLHALNRHPHPLPEILASLEGHIQRLQEEIRALQQQIARLLDSDHAWHTAAQHLQSIPGVGVITAAYLLTATHNFARCQTPEQAAAFAGLAPHARQSGSSVRRKPAVGGGGCAPLRHVLYMAAVASIRYNPRLQAFYFHLLQRGKLKKVALCAVARKLVHLAWAVVTHHCDFDPHFPLAT
jgi:transposase